MNSKTFFTQYYNDDILKKTKLISDKNYPCFLLIKEDGWNDYWSYRTLHRLQYYDEDGTCVNIGEVKILDKNNGDTIIPTSFEELDDNYCSLGCDTDYYRNLKKYSKKYRTFLKK